MGAKVLVYLFGSLGDNIASIPALRAIRRHFGGAEIVVLQNIQSAMPVKASDVLPDEYVDRYLDYSTPTSAGGRFAELSRVWRVLRRERFDAAVYLAISERPGISVVRDKMFFRSSGINKLYGFHSFPKAELYPRDENKRPLRVPSEAKRRIDRLERDGISSYAEDLQPPFAIYREADLDEMRNWLAASRENADGLIAIAPGCKTASNRWPIERFAEIGRRLLADGKTDVVIVGGRAERELGDKLIDVWGRGINAAGVMSVRRSAALLALCEAYIGLDTGTTHLAAAVGTPVFALYGERNNPGQWFPPGSQYTLLFRQVECAGCRLEDCTVPERPCMLGIETGAVWEHFSRFVDDVRGGGPGQAREISV